MSKSFNYYKAKPTFAQFKEPLVASDYTSRKKIKYSFCSPNICHPNKNIYSESNFLMLKTANNLATNPCGQIDKTQLYINLITKLELNNDITVILDNSGNIVPAIIDPNSVSFLRYNVDPSGVLFGNDLCSIENWEKYLVYKK
jgi:hypothetical protein